jgi:hypothetical protein
MVGSCEIKHEPARGGLQLDFGGLGAEDFEEEEACADDD